MGKNEIRIEQQIKDRIKVFNRQRIISIIAIGFLLIVLSHLPLIAGYEIPPFYFAMLCSFGLISLSVTFVLPFRQATIIFLVSIMINNDYGRFTLYKSDTLNVFLHVCPSRCRSVCSFAENRQGFH